MERYKIAICDDDRRFIDYMKELLLSVSEKPAEFYPYISGEQLLADSGRMHHLIIMDIGLGGLDGFQTSKKVREVNADAVLIFCTGEFEPLPEFFEVSAYRYLKKQYGEERMKTELRAVLKKVDDCYEQQFLTGKDSLGGLCKVPLEKIAYISKAKNGSTIHTVEEAFGREQTYAVKKHLMQLREELKMQGFGRPHDSYLVNFRHIIRCDNTTLTLCNEKILSISRSKYKDFMDEMVQYWGGKY